MRKTRSNLAERGLTEAWWGWPRCLMERQTVWLARLMELSLTRQVGSWLDARLFSVENRQPWRPSGQELKTAHTGAPMFPQIGRFLGMIGNHFHFSEKERNIEAHCVKVLAHLHDNLSLMPGIHMGEN